MNTIFLVSAGNALNEGLMIGRSLELFLIMMAAGGVIALLFDFFRAVRKATKTAYKEVTYAVHIEDVLFALLAFAIFIFVVVVFNDGEIRGFMIFGLVCGILIYWALISQIINKILFWIIYLLFKILSAPVRLVAKIKKMFEKRKNSKEK